MDQIDLIGWTITASLILFGVLRWLTATLNHATAAKTLPSRHSIPQGGRVILAGFAGVLGLGAIVGSITGPLPGLWGPAVLLFAVAWRVNADWKVRYLPWLVPVEDGLILGERILLLGGSVGTLVAYLLSETLTGPGPAGQGALATAIASVITVYADAATRVLAVDTFWSALLAQLFAAIAGAAVGVIGVLVGFRLQSRSARRASVDDAAERVLVAISDYVTAGTKDPGVSPHAVSIAFEILVFRVKGSERDRAVRLRDTWIDVRDAKDLRVRLHVSGYLAGDVSAWRANADRRDYDFDSALEETKAVLRDSAK